MRIYTPDGAKLAATAALLQATWRHDIDTIVVWHLDQWSLSLADQVGMLRALQALGVGCISRLR